MQRRAVHLRQALQLHGRHGAGGRRRVRSMRWSRKGTAPRPRELRFSRAKVHEGPGSCTRGNCIFDQPCKSCGKTGVVSVRTLAECCNRGPESLLQNRRVVCPRCDGRGKVRLLAVIAMTRSSLTMIMQVHDSHMHHSSSNCIFCTSCNTCRGQGML